MITYSQLLKRLTTMGTTRKVSVPNRPKATITTWFTLVALTLVLSGCGSTVATSPVHATGQPSANGAPAFQPAATAKDRAQRWSSPPAMTVNTASHYVATVYTTYGHFTVQLFAAQAPHTVNNFMFLARHNFYDGDLFFRIIKPYMVQTGDPQQDGSGGPGYQFADELPVTHSYKPGIVAMANAGPNTNGSQFFICTGAEAAQILDQQPNYTQFGRVISGMAVVKKIAAIPVKLNAASGEQSAPTKAVYIERIVINQKR